MSPSESESAADAAARGGGSAPTRRYVIEGEIGRGGMGIVYRASDTKLDRSVALKVLSGLVDDPRRMRRLEQEAITLASLNHPNVATIHTFEDSGRVPFLVLELVEGETLRARLERARLPLAEALSVCAQVAAALEAAHARNIIHRDLNPKNVMLTPLGRVKVLDFGLAARTLPPRAGLAADDSGQLPGVIVGTPGYLSPEQARREEVDERGDVWALGCVLYEALTGNRAFPGESWMDMMRATLETEPDWQALESVSTPHEVARLLRACLEKDPGRRLGDIGAVRRELEKSLDHLPRPAAPGGMIREAPRHNLPAPMNSVVNRASQLEEIGRLLTTGRLVTLTGVGGCGKTHLALRAGRALVRDFADGVWLVELASVSDPALVPRAVASVLGLREESEQTRLRLLTEYLEHKEILLVLDNCEHLLEACAALTDGVLRACPRLKVLASSREGLGIAGERTFRVPSLTLPGSDSDISLEALRGSEAVELFVDRAVESAGDFELGPDNAMYVAQVCRRLDGLPLALELAAARVRVLSVRQIAERLDNVFRLLTGGSKTALPRHQTLRAALDWSFELLAPDEVVLLRRLAVFAGGFTLEAVEAICSGDGIAVDDVLDLLTHLVDKSLVAVHRVAGAARYRLLETVRQYGRENLLESGESEALRDRHRDFFIDWAESAEERLKGRGQATWLRSLEYEHDNLRAVLEWCMGSPAGIEPGLRLCMALLHFWEMRGHLGEGRRRIGEALAHAEGSGVVGLRGKALEAAGALAERQGDYASARSLLEQSLEVFREVGDERGIGLVLLNLGNVHRDQGDLTRAAELYQESLERFEELGYTHGQVVALGNLGLIPQHQGDLDRAWQLFERSLELGRSLEDKHSVARALNNLGMIAIDRGDNRAAYTLLDESLTLKEELGDRRGIAHALGNLGRVAFADADRAGADRLYRRSLALFREIGFRHGVAWMLESLALLMVASEPERAVRFLGAAEAIRTAIGAPLRPDEREGPDAVLAEARGAIGDERTEEAVSAGACAALDELLDRAPSDRYR